MGFGVTHDGVHWRALPSPEMHPPLHGEVGAVEYIRYGPNLSKAGYYAILGTGGHMLTYNASSPEGPFRGAVKNREVLPSAHSCYFARFFWSADGELLVTHHDPPLCTLQLRAQRACRCAVLLSGCLRLAELLHRQARLLLARAHLLLDGRQPLMRC